MSSVLSITAPRTMVIVEEPAPALKPGQVRVRTLYSGISAGTELTSYRGSNPHLTRRWDAGTRLFSGVAGDAQFPVVGFGYEEVGEVIEVAADVTSLTEGERVWGTWGHRTSVVADADALTDRTLEPTADPRIGIFSHIGAIALNVVLDADIHVGETAVVFGLGVPGQLVAQLARANGARVIVVDGIASRRQFALDLGADIALDPASGDVAEQVRALTRGRGADVCLEISGNYRALHEAIRSVAYSSRVVAGGFYQGEGAGLSLGEEFHHNRVQLVTSQISGLSPSLSHRWDRFRLARTAIDLAVAGRIAVVPLISHELPFSQAAEAFTMIDERPAETLQVVLTFDGADS
jgi:2-desacetyl-2-hydroxyethyl bacteriochlorophyllide A dehydrogenase